jgi:uncharacterized protein
MGRILFFVVLALAIYVAWRWLQRRDDAQRRSGSAAAHRPLQAMVSCATCGLHLPRDEALLLGDRYFCCEDHRRAAPPA